MIPGIKNSFNGLISRLNTREREAMNLKIGQYKLYKQKTKTKLNEENKINLKNCWTIFESLKNI